MKEAVGPERTAWVAAGSSVASLLAAMSCCLPIAPLLGAVGLVGFGALIEPLRPWLMGASAVMLGWGFWRMYRRRSCAVKRGLMAQMLLWTSAGMLVLFLVAPQMVANFLADVWPQ